MSDTRVSTLAGMRLAGQVPGVKVSTVAGMRLTGTVHTAQVSNLVGMRLAGELQQVRVSTMAGMAMHGRDLDPNPPAKVSGLGAYVLMGRQGDAKVSRVVAMKLQSRQDHVVAEASRGLLQIRLY